MSMPVSDTGAFRAGSRLGARLDGGHALLDHLGGDPVEFGPFFFGPELILLHGFPSSLPVKTMPCLATAEAEEDQREYWIIHVPQESAASLIATDESIPKKRAFWSAWATVPVLFFGHYCGNVLL